METVTKKVEEVQDNNQEQIEQVKEQVEEVVEQVKEKTEQLVEKVEEKAEQGKNDIKSLVQKLLKKAQPYGTEITMGAIFGYCAGYFSKKMAQKAAYYVGGAFVALQVLQYQGYVQMNYHKMQTDALQHLDQDGDGKFTQKDAKQLLSKYLRILQTKLPSSAGFVTAFYYGVRA